MPIHMTSKQKEHYNHLLTRLSSAKTYMDNNNISIREREEYVPVLQKLMKDMDMLVKKHKLTDRQIEGGFRICT